jgi:phage-related protein (TIGR01555 family)
MRIFAKEQEIANRMLTEDSFVNFVSRLGVGNNANNEGNTISDGFYEFNLVTRNRIKLEAAYRGSWIVGVMIDSIAEDMTKAGIDIDTSDGKDQVKDVVAGFQKLAIWNSLCDNTKWGRLYGGSIGVLQIEGQDMSTPLKIDTIAKGQFKGIVTYDRWQVNPVVNDLIESGPDLGLPRMYQIVTSPLSVEPNADMTMTGVQNVHHSRVIRAIGIKLPFFQAITEQMWGESVLERLWDRLIAFDNATMSAASLIDRANLRTVQIENLREIVGAGGAMYDGLIAQMEMMREFQVNEGITLLDKNDVFASTSYTFSGLSDVLLQLGQQLSGASTIPLVRLFGQSPAGLSATGESDMRIYYDGINTRQNTELRQPVDLLLRVMWRHVHGKAAPKDLDFNFTPLWQMTATDKVNNAKTSAETVIGAYEAGLTKRSSSLEELRTASGDTGIFSHISDEDIAEADEELDPPPGETDPAEPVAGGKPDLKVLAGGKGIDPAAPNPKTDPATTPVKGLGDAKPRRAVGDSKPARTKWWARAVSIAGVVAWTLYSLPIK